MVRPVQLKELSSNPLSFPRHRRSLEEWQALIRTARKHREAVIPYSDSRRVLEFEEFGITISAREYYNSARKMIPDKGQPQTIGGLLIALQEEGFMYRTRVKIEEDDAGELLSVRWTPERPRAGTPPRAPSPLPPASTAPPTLGGSLGKRKRTITARYQQGREEGLNPSIGYSQQTSTPR